MTNEQKLMLGNDYGFAILPYHFKEAITKHCNYDYKNEKIDNVLTAKLGSLGKFWKFIEGVSYLQLSENKIKIQQNKNQKSASLIPLLKGVEKIFVYFKNGQKEIETHKSIFKSVDVCVIDFDFDNEIKKLELHFNYEIVEPLVIEVETELYQEPIIDKTSELLQKLNIKHSCGTNLVTIKFANSTENVALTKISLFDSEKQLMGVFKVEEGMFYKSITDLAFGKYFYKVEQYDKENKMIVSTDYIEFRILPPYYDGGKMQVCN